MSKVCHCSYLYSQEPLFQVGERGSGPNLALYCMALSLCRESVDLLPPPWTSLWLNDKLMMPWGFSHMLFFPSEPCSGLRCFLGDSFSFTEAEFLNTSVYNRLAFLFVSSVDKHNLALFCTDKNPHPNPYIFIILYLLLCLEYGEIVIRKECMNWQPWQKGFLNFFHLTTHPAVSGDFESLCAPGPLALFQFLIQSLPLSLFLELNLNLSLLVLSQLV